MLWLVQRAVRLWSAGRLCFVSPTFTTGSDLPNLEQVFVAILKWRNQWKAKGDTRFLSKFFMLYVTICNICYHIFHVHLVFLLLQAMVRTTRTQHQCEPHTQSPLPVGSTTLKSRLSAKVEMGKQSQLWTSFVACVLWYCGNRFPAWGQ